jgi:hypothetical protein
MEFDPANVLLGAVVILLVTILIGGVFAVAFATWGRRTRAGEDWLIRDLDELLLPPQDSPGPARRHLAHHQPLGLSPLADPRLAASSRRDGAASGSTLHQRGTRVGLRFVTRVPASILPSSSCGQSNTKDSRKDPIARRETSRPRFASRRVVIHSAWHAQEERFKDDAKRLVRWCYRDFLTTHSIDRAGAVVLFGPRPSGQAGSLRVPVHPR